MPTSYHPSPFSCSLKHSSIHRFLFWNFFFFDYFFLCLLNVVSNRYVIFKLATKERDTNWKKIKSSKVSSDHSRWLEQTYFFFFLNCQLFLTWELRKATAFIQIAWYFLIANIQYNSLLCYIFHNPSFLYSNLELFKVIFRCISHANLQSYKSLFVNVFLCRTCQYVLVVSRIKPRP